jgi:hypothetical protein
MIISSIFWHVTEKFHMIFETARFAHVAVEQKSLGRYLSQCFYRDIVYFHYFGFI